MVCLNAYRNAEVSFIIESRKKKGAGDELAEVVEKFEDL